MEHIALLFISVGSKELAIGGARSENTLIHTNQLSASIDIRVHSDWEIFFKITNSYNKMSIYFGWNTNDGIGVNP